MEINSAWKESTQKIFWGVIVIAVAGIFSTVYDYVSLATEFMSKLAEFLPGGIDRGISSFLTAINGMGILVKLAIVVGYVLYLMGLTQFAAMQSNNVAAFNIQKVRKAVIILICCFVATVLFGILLKIPGVGLLITLAIWVATLVAYFMMKKAFGVLMISPAFSAKAQNGAKRLRTAALCNIWVMLLPIIAVLVAALFALTLFSSMSSGGRNGESLLYVGGVILALMAICAIIMLIIALVYPFIGWYQIMKGGPGEDVLTDAAEIEQRMAAIPTADEQMKAMKEKSEAALASAKESFANLQKDMAPKLEEAKTWTKANKKALSIGAGAVAIAALLIWLIPKLIGVSPIAFETYEVMDDDGYHTSIDIPKGDGEKEQNLTAGIREIISQSDLGKEIGLPSDGSLQEVMSDYQKRYHQFAKDYCRNNQAPSAPECEFELTSIFQNEASVTFAVADAIYFNGSPDYYNKVVRLSDGHVMAQEEMVSASMDDLVKLIEKYVGDDMPISVYSLEDGYWFSPSSGDSCMVVWPVSRAVQGKALIPLSDMEPYLTEAGKELFMAKPLKMPEKTQSVPNNPDEGSESSEDVGENDLEVEYESEESNTGLVVDLPEGTTEYVGDMVGFPIEFTIHKNTKEGVLRADYRNVKYSTTMKLEGESLPADDGNISFFGNDGQGNNWSFNLSGDAQNITGTAQSGGKELKVTLHRK